MKLLILSLGVVRLVASLPALELRQSMGSMAMGGGSFPYPIDKDLVESKNVIKIRYGPYRVPASSESTPFMMNMKKPCDSCWVTALQGDLEYADGKVANADTGAWLHHMQVNRQGTGKKDMVCGASGFSIQGTVGERIYSVGNERELSRLNGKAKYGLLFKPADKISAMPELMNESKAPISVYIILKYEILPLTAPEAQGYKEAVMLWLDITGCGISSEMAVKGAYEKKQAPGWTSTINGKLMYATGHVHDGGLKTSIYRKRNNEVKNICESHARYGGRAGYKGADGMDHISAMSYCDFSKDDSLKVGDVLYVGATYNTTQHMLMESPGRNHMLEPIMGISRIYVGT